MVSFPFEILIKFGQHSMKKNGLHTIDKSFFKKCLFFPLISVSIFLEKNCDSLPLIIQFSKNAWFCHLYVSQFFLKKSEKKYRPLTLKFRSKKRTPPPPFWPWNFVQKTTLQKIIFDHMQPGNMFFLIKLKQNFTTVVDFKKTFSKFHFFPIGTFLERSDVPRLRNSLRLFGNAGAHTVSKLTLVFKPFP